jgi:hypothetical protein
MSHPKLFTAVLGTIAGSLALAGAALAADEVGRVTAVGGDATAQQPGAAPRPLACGDAVLAGDTLRTGADSHVGVQMDDVATHLDGNSELVVGRTPHNTPSARLTKGKVRMVDPRETGADPAQLSVLAADAQVAGNDAEGYVFSEKVGPYAMLCEWDQPLPVTRGNEHKTADPNRCVIAKPKEPLYTANAHDARIPALAQECAGPDLASLNSPLRHLTARDVASPGPAPGTSIAGFGDVNPSSAIVPAYTCDVAGSCSPQIPITVVEPPPVGGCENPALCGLP